MPAGRHSQVKFAALDERHHGHGRQTLRPAREPEARVDGVRDAKAAVRQAVGTGEQAIAMTVDAHDTREAGRRRDLVDRFREAVHERSLGATVTPPIACLQRSAASGVLTVASDEQRASD
jgi:hypothetical protein